MYLKTNKICSMLPQLPIQSSILYSFSDVLRKYVVKKTDQNLKFIYFL